MITSVHIQNYRSFIDASVKLRPLSLVVGANGAGKTNFAKAVTLHLPGHTQVNREVVYLLGNWPNHVNQPTLGGHITWATTTGEVRLVKGDKIGGPAGRIRVQDYQQARLPIPIFTISAESVSAPEMSSMNPVVASNGKGTAQVLESLRSGDRDDLFDKIETLFKRYVPEVEKLSLRTVSEGTKQIQVRERGLDQLLPATELSEGTRIILCLLTIIHQEKPPPLVLLEDIDRGLHPRLFEYLVPVMRDIAERNDINIIATTHNPYLVDCFQDDKEAVIIVEKKDGASTLTTLADRLKDLDYDSVDPEDMPLGNLWFTGLVGGVPPRINLRRD